jgi:hypothetical protein
MWQQLKRHEETILIVIFVIVILLGAAFARDDGAWDPKIREWFAELKQPDHPNISCCGEADAFESDIFSEQYGQYVAVITNGRGVIPNGTRMLIPDEKIKWDRGNPTGHGWVFVGTAGQIYCYITPGGA